MNLSPEETARFYRIWWPLLNYVNVKRKLKADFPASPEERSVSPQEVYPIRQALWKSDELREAFVADNPADLAAEDLALVESWRHRVAGNFYIFRHLKSHTVFLVEGRPSRAYGVVGLVSPIEDVVPQSPPVLVNAVLLPFEDKIIYDSILNAYPIYFGGGIRGDLNDSYREAQERGGVITTLRPLGEEETRERLDKGNKKVLTAFRKDLAASGLSLKKIGEHTEAIAAFADFLLDQDQPRPLLDVTTDDVATYVERLKKKSELISLKRFVRFLLNSGRTGWENAQEMQDLVKREQASRS